MHIDVYHDIACPWCRIGKANLDAALQNWDGEPITITWQPFLLDQSLPKTGIPLREHYQAKFGPENIGPIFERVSGAGRDVGLEFNFDEAIRAPTEDAHRLILLAPEERNTAVLEGLHRAYFNEGKNVADLETLAYVAEAAGMDRGETLDRLQSDEGKAATAAAIQGGQRLGVTGVPFFVFDARYALSGAQPPATLQAAMRQTVEDRVGASSQP